MKIALDYDETFTADPEFWEDFIKLAESRGHEVTIVTFRSEEGYMADLVHDAQKCGVKWIATSGKQKAGQFEADVWIDDSPICIPDAVDLTRMLRGCIMSGDV